MKIHTGNSSRYHASQIDRIEKGFVELGHEITPHISEADLVYENNAPFAPRIEDKRRGVIKGKLIGTVLDVPEHLPDFDYKTQRQELCGLDAICTISEFVQEQVKYHYRFDSHIIYQPIKPISLLGDLDRYQTNLLMHCGRRQDSNKRFHLAVQALQILGVPETNVALVGSEPYPWGTHLAVLADGNLNGVYNQSDFVLATSFLEGLSLPVLEAMACGAIPVVCNDMTTRTELLPPDLFPEYDAVFPNPGSIATFIGHLMNNEDRKRAFKKRLYDHFTTNWAHRVSGRAVAERIISVYNTLV